MSSQIDLFHDAVNFLRAAGKMSYNNYAFACARIKLNKNQWSEGMEIIGNSS